MEKNSLLVIIFEGVCGLVCIGLGIYYIVCGAVAQVAVFMVVGAVCIAMAVRAFLNMRKQKRDREKENRDNNSKQ
ncbi:MAG: hypothetical protein K2K38_02410 [Clostridia bacterium]|nr:hypothetical protein [Clostridia bacterium]